MKIENIKNYLNEKITNSWYKNSEIDYGISGKFLDCETIGNDLKIIWEEMGEQLEMVVSWFTEYSPEQIYNIWMEEVWFSNVISKNLSILFSPLSS